MKFKYKIQNKNHEIIEGIADAPDRFFLARELRKSGSLPMSIKEYKEKAEFFSFKFSLFGGGVSLSEKVIFTNNLSGMLTAGLSLTRALGVLQKQSKNKAFNNILKSLVEDVNKGYTLSDAMKKFPKVFSPIFVSMVRSGEESGGLPKALSEIGSNLKKTYDLTKKVKGALTYPSIIVGAIFIIGVLMMIYVVPTLTKTFKDVGAELPATTRVVIGISDFLTNHLILFLLIVSALVGGGLMFAKLPTTRRYFDYIVVRLPAVGKILKEMNAARTARTLSSLLSSGVDMSKALTITEEVLQNSYYKAVIHNSVDAIERGMPLSDSFKNNTDLYPVMVGEMIEVGEETGNLSPMLLDIATFYEGEVDNKTKDLSTIIEPVLMVFIGAAVGFFAISMISPMYSIMSTIK
jgi:type II secretory pathway component PulF